jgi:D-beta-D-heptose 7-phosphate kinase / D-beta-D-heptose 1-phosphate adenosyltransferase
MVVLITGVFDVLHEEHITFLRNAKELGGRLLVGIESDVRVQKIKGAARPVNSQQERKKNLEALAIADEVFVLPEKFDTVEDRRRLLKKLHPDILAVSSHTPFLAEKLQLMQEIGGRVEVVHQHNPEVSSTILLERNQA